MASFDMEQGFIGGIANRNDGVGFNVNTNQERGVNLAPRFPAVFNTFQDHSQGRTGNDFGGYLNSSQIDSNASTVGRDQSDNPSLENPFKLGCQDQSPAPRQTADCPSEDIEADTITIKQEEDIRDINNDLWNMIEDDEGN